MWTFMFSKMLTKTLLKPNAARIMFSRKYLLAVKPVVKFMNIFDRNPNAKVSPALDEWIREYGSSDYSSLVDIIRLLRYKKRYNQALEVFEWMIRNNKPGKLPHSDQAIQLGLIGRVHGLEAAERFFESMDGEDIVQETYQALIFCYSSQGDIRRCLLTLETMKKLGFAPTTLDYNNIIAAYANTGQIEKVPHVLSKMKTGGVMLNAYTYSICINNYLEKLDFDCVDKVFEEADRQQATFYYHTYAALATIYVKAGQHQKAMDCVGKCAEFREVQILLNDENSYCLEYGKKERQMRLFSFANENIKWTSFLQRMNLFGDLVGSEDFEYCEQLLKEWDKPCMLYDFRLPNILISGYCEKGLIEKAEAVIHGIIERQKNAHPTSWAIVASAYEKAQNMEKARECSALALQGNGPPCSFDLIRPYHMPLQNYAHYFDRF